MARIAEVSNRLKRDIQDLQKKIIQNKGNPRQRRYVMSLNSLMDLSWPLVERVLAGGEANIYCCPEPDCRFRTDSPQGHGRCPLHTIKEFIGEGS